MSSSPDIKFPLNGLISILQGEGFEVSTRTVLDLQKVIAHLGEDDIQDTGHLKFLLSPLICRNKEEQEKFYQLFDLYEEKIKAGVKQDVTRIIEDETKIKEEQEKGEGKPGLPAEQKKKTRRRYFIIIAGILLFAVASILAYRYFFPDQDTYLFPQIFISTGENTIEAEKPADITDMAKPDQVPDEITINSPVTFNAGLSDTVEGESYTFRWQVNDSVINTKERSFTNVFAQPGEYIVTVFCENNGQQLTQAETTVKILCENSPLVKIERDSALPRRVNEKVQRIYKARFINPGDEKKYSYAWVVTTDTAITRSDQKVLNYPADLLSSYKVSLVVKGHLNPACVAYNAEDSSVFELAEKPELAVKAEGIKPLQRKRQLNEAFVSRLIVFCLLFPGIFIYNIYKERLKALVNKYFKPVAGEDDSKKVKGHLTEPYHINFKAQEDKITREIAISQLAETLRKRHSSDVYRLSIGKTIRNTIRKGGFPVFEFTPRTKPADFLIFIDAEYPGSHLLKLYNYVISCLKKEQVNLTVYSYYREPLLLSNESLNHLLIPVEKLARLYPGTILFLFTDATSFFKPMDMRLQDWVADKFKGWDTKLIFTSVAKRDWGSREMQLYNAGFTVVPADVNAHQLITDEINNMIDRQKLKKTVIPDVYSSRLINFNEWKDVKEYLRDACKKNNSILAGETDYHLLKEWLCATAVYPQVNWEVTIAVGKAIEKEKCRAGELVNYSNLLVLGRIQWLQDGQLTDTMRIEMLKELGPATEITSRVAINGLLDEIKEDIPESSVVYGEYDLQRTTNRFLIRKYREKEIGFDDKDYLAVKRYSENDQFDTPVEIYLNDPDANSPIASSGKSLPLEKYIEKQEKDKLSHNERVQREYKQAKRSLLRKTAAWLTVIIAVAVLLLTAVFDFKPLVYSQTASRTLSFSRGDLPGLQVDKLSVNINGKDYNAENLGIDSFRIKALPVDTSLNATITLTTSNPAGQDFTGAINMGFENYAISLAEPPALIPLDIRYNNEEKYQGIETQLSSILRTYAISSRQNANTGDTLNRIIYYENSQAAAAESIAQNIKTELGTDLRTEYVNQPGAAMTIFLYFKQEIITNCTSSNLPPNLSEIWKGGTSNRLLSINPASRMIYYSTGVKTSYGSYRISEVCRNGAGVYRIITSAGGKYKVFFIKDISNSSFSLSVCQNLYETQEKAREVMEANCDRFNTMNLYYENNSRRIFLPVRPVSLQVSESNKIKRIADSITVNTKRNADIQIVTAVYENERYLPAANEKTVLEYLPDNGVVYDLRNDDWLGMFPAGPFDRNYITVELKITYKPTDDEPRLDCKRVFNSLKEALSVDPGMVCNLNLSNQSLESLPGELSRFVNLQSLDIRNNKLNDKDSTELFTRFSFIKTIRFSPQVKQPPQKWRLITTVTLNSSQMPDSRFDKFFIALYEELRRNNQARVKIVAFHDLKSSPAAAERSIRGVTSYLKKNRWDTYINGRRVILEVSDDVLKTEQVSSMIFFSGEQSSVSVYGLNMTTNFLSTLGVNTR